jgi:3-oxoacyl-[acyl-carrier-protein] synthase II
MLRPGSAADAGLLASDAVTDGSTGVSYGSTSGSPPAMEIYARNFLARTLKGIGATDYILFATSTRNDEPARSPRPFDRQRDGLVVGEGAATLVLEELAHARARNARIYAEVVGFATNCDGRHITNPDVVGIFRRWPDD